jgi:murein L,D-transpeptidase YafK
MLHLILLLTIAAAPVDSGPTSDRRDEASLRGKLPTSIIRLSEGGYALLVEKSTQSLILYRGTADGTPGLVRVVSANTGERAGDKLQEGDLRTPEGIYFFTSIIDGRKLPPEYGVRAFVTDFPNVFDRLAGKKGSNIWLHATDEPERVENGYNTRGCVVLTNDDMNGLTPLIKPGTRSDATVLVVRDELELLNQPAASEQRRSMIDLVKGWEEAWESMDIDRYMAFYSRSFAGMGRDYDALRAYKGRLTRQYQHISVEISNLQLFRHDGELVAVFDQSYHSDRYRARSTKRLYFMNEAGSWKIVRESSTLLP